MPQAITPESPFTTIAQLVREHASERPDALALCDEQQALSWQELDRLMDRVAAALQRDGLQVGDAIAICAQNSVRYAALYLGALRAGVVVAPMAPSTTAQSLALMLGDAGAQRVFADSRTRELMPPDVPVIWLDDTQAAFDNWLAPAGTAPKAVEVSAEAAFNIIYSSGTTGTPKGIVQSHGMRWQHVCRGARYGYSSQTRTLLSTPLYSNTTLVVFFPTIAFGGCVHLMSKFDAHRYLDIAAAQRITHTMLVPVQYQRIMAVPDFARFDLSAFQMKFCTSAPFQASIKADVLARWPGGLVEFYGMTEGGGTCILNAHERPDKLHTVGQPAPGHDMRLIDEEGRELPPGATGEVVGRSGAMMAGYHQQPDKTREVEWFDAAGQRFIRTGDVGRFDEDGFLVLMDRRKDMIISGGFNIYPSDLEAQLRQHPAVADVAVVGVPSVQWGETPVAFVVRHAGEATPEDQLKEWHNARCGKTQRLAAVQFIDELPRSAIGKVLKRELRERLTTQVQ
jgi:long-chain acyl-CoA synthetase